MSRQPSDKVGEGSGPFHADSGLDARLDRAVPGIGAEAFLMGIGGAHGGRIYPIRHNTVVIGRSIDADIALLDPSVSARHAQLINGSHGFEIEDLGSTNGTTVQGRKITRAPLNSGDRISVGQIEFKFLVDRRIDATMTVIPPGMPTGQRWGGGMVRYESPAPAPRRSSADADDEDGGASLEEIMGRLAAGYQFLRRNALLLIVFAAVGGFGGMASVVLIPPTREAQCVLKLNPRVKANPVSPQYRGREEDEEIRFFDAADSVFVQPELVNGTLEKMVGHPLPASTVDAIAKRLKLEGGQPPDHIYRASYREKAIGGFPLDPAAFLSAHLDNYLHTEIAHAIQVFTAQTDFLRGQLKAVEADMGKLSEEKMHFSQNNSDRLPDTASQALTTRVDLERRRSELTAQIRGLQGQLDAERKALAAEGPLAQGKYRDSETYRASLADLNRKLEDAYAHGLADGHPDVRAIKEEKQRIEGLIAKQLSAHTDPLVRASNAGYQEIQGRIALLQAQLTAAKADLSDTERDLRKIATVVEDLPRVQAGVQHLVHMQEATTTLHSQLFEQLKKAELQLNLERVSEESRYEIIAPPRLVNSGRMKTAAMRLGMGTVLGLVLAFVILAGRKVRRMFVQALANLEASASPGGR
jgi:pSer/pThr/pTyr-binding forkhead associated (FHA) protein